MNIITSFLLEVAITLIICNLVIIYLRPFLKRILTDLCGTEERAQFWTVFSNILLVGLPLIIALGYYPEALTPQALFFEITEHISGNLAGFLASLVGIGIMVSFFALTAPRSCKVEAK